MCALEADGIRRQRELYRRAGRGASLVTRTRRRLVLELAGDVEPSLVDELIAVERACCPFFTIAWSPSTRLLSFGVDAEEHEPALEAIAFAVG
jgi:hypothetical protein